MKNMKKLLQKAMVFTLAVAMLAGTPLTASAAGLADIYKTEDGWGNVVGSNGEDDTRTGTVTATQTNSGVLDAKEAELKGIILEEAEFEFELPKDEKGTSLTARLDWGVPDSDVPAEKKELESELLKHLKWSSSDRNVVALQIPDGSYGDGSREKMNIVPKGHGEATITVSLDSDAHNIHYTQVANVTVMQYAGALKFREVDLRKDAWSNSSLDLNDYVVRYADKEEKFELKSSLDNLTFTLVNNGGKQATLKNSVLTLKKPTKTDEIVEVRVSGKYVDDTAKFPIKAGSSASKVTFTHKVGDETTTGTKFSWRVNDGNIATVTAHVDDFKKADSDSPDYCTDSFTWSSANSAIVEIDGDRTSVNDREDNNYEVQLKAVAVGKTQITAKASSGKSFKLTATVSADLEEIKIEESALPDVLHSGQTIDLYKMANQYFGEYVDHDFTDAGLKWEFDKEQGDVTAMKKVATLSTKGVLTIKPNVFDPKGTQKIFVKAVNAKKIGTGSSAIKAGAIEKAGKDDFELEQVTIDGITVVKKDENGTTCVNISVDEKGKVKKVTSGITDNIDVDKRSTFTLSATGTKWTIEDGSLVPSEEPVPIDATDFLGWTASGNGKIVKATKDASNIGAIEGVKKGTATITISGAAAKPGKKEGTWTFSAAKATFKEKVLAPSKTLTLSLKKTTIQALDKKQSIVVTPKMDKGTTTTKKDKDIAWNVYVKNGVSFTKEDEITIQDGKVQGNFNDYAGRRFRVTATVKDTGVTASIDFDVVEPNKSKPTFGVTNEDSIESTVTTISVKEGGSKNVKVNVAIRGDDLSTGAAVTYTVNKPDVAFVLQDPNVPNGIIIHGIKAGTAKITAKTADGKSATLTVKVEAASTQQ